MGGELVHAPLMAELGLTGALRGTGRRITMADAAAALPPGVVGFACVAFLTDAYAGRSLGRRIAATRPIRWCSIRANTRSGRIGKTASWI